MCFNNQTLALCLQLHQNEFNVSASLYELYQYAVKYNSHVSLTVFVLHSLYLLGRIACIVCLCFNRMSVLIF